MRSLCASKVRVIAEPALACLWAPRNAEEHGLAEVAALQERIIAVAAFGGYEEERGPPGPKGEITATVS